jgi:hypothetical protein
MLQLCFRSSLVKAYQITGNTGTLLHNYFECSMHSILAFLYQGYEVRMQLLTFSIASLPFTAVSLFYVIGVDNFALVSLRIKTESSTTITLILSLSKLNRLILRTHTCLTKNERLLNFVRKIFFLIKNYTL